MLRGIGTPPIGALSIQGVLGDLVYFGRGVYGEVFSQLRNIFMHIHKTLNPKPQSFTDGMIRNWLEGSLLTATRGMWFRAY